MNIPEQYLPVMPYLILNQATAFLAFAKDVFGATEQLIVPGDKEREIMHGEIRIGDAVIMFAQSTETYREKSAGMFIYVKNLIEVYDKALRANAISLVTPSRQEYGFTAGFEDPFGNQWWITEAEK